MTPWLRPLLVLMVLLAVSPVSPLSPLSLTSPSYAADPSPSETRAGSVPGDGRARPGRDEPAPASAEASVPPYTPPERPPASTPPPPPPPVAKPPDKATSVSDTTRRTATEPPVPALRVLPLGSGLVLIGLGLAFFAVRLRRG